MILTAVSYKKFVNYLLLIILLQALTISTVWAATIYNPIASYNATSFYFTYTASSTQDFYRVYIDNTKDPTTGFRVGNVGAKYLIENRTLYRYVGPGWNWAIVKDIPFAISNNKPQWTISRNDVGSNACAGSLNYVYQIQYGYTINTGTQATLNFAAGDGCSSNPTPVPATQKIAIPSYFWPDCANNSNCYWNQLNQAVPKVGLTVINPDSGVGRSADPAFVKAVQGQKAAGGTVIGYVYTSYGARSASAIKSEIDNYYNWYQVDGIFFDEGYANDCAKMTYYQGLSQYVKSKGGKGLTVVNYGGNTQECYVNSSDILLTFESDYQAYLNWRPASWQANYPTNRFWHLVYGVTQGNLLNTMNLTKKNRAGWVYVTPLGLPNPWGALPSSTYWSTELNALQ